MAKVVVTGGAGFIGSRLAIELCKSGDKVTILDRLSDYYDTSIKLENLAAFSAIAASAPVIADINTVDLDPILRDCDVIYHLAAQPGVRLSWSAFDQYVDDNVRATYRLVDSAIRNRVRRIVFASSSSIYGNASRYPTSEDTPLQPVSPYGVTKVTGEQLLAAACLGGELEVAALRFFTVYGPGQRPDMAMQRLVTAALTGGQFQIYGDGSQVRDFTFVDDIIRACRAAALRPLVTPFRAFNIGGSVPESMNSVIATIEAAAGASIDVVRRPEVRGDVKQTGADASRARDELGWEAQTRIAQGLRQQVECERLRLAASVESPAQVSQLVRQTN